MSGGADASTSRRGVAVVTGGTAGIGRAAVRCLAERGWDVGIIARGRERLDATVREVEALGRRAVGVSADVADAAALDAAADEIESSLGAIDVWVNNAFTGAIAFFDALTAEEFERITQVTYLGFANGTRTALSRMAPRDRGTVVQVGSALAFRGIPLQAVYCGAKHAIGGFTESVRAELLHKGSNVALCQVHLLGVNTPQFDWVLSRGIDHHPMPVPPIYQPEVAGRAIAGCAERPRRQMFVGLPTVLTVLGNRFAPSLLDHFLARTNVEDQQSPDHDPPGKDANTWEPVGGAEIAAHGVFDEQAHAHSPLQWVNERRGIAAGIGGALVALAAARSLRS